jgi:parallel beta-helix repeat protein
VQEKAQLGLVGALIVAAMLALPALAGAATFNVDPGRNAIQRAVNKADDGDVIRVHRGKYREDVVVDKAVHIVGVGKRRPRITGRCRTDRVIDVQSGGVTLERLRVRGAAHLYTINMLGIPSGTVKNVAMRETCRGADAALYGINVFGAGPLELRNNDAKGFTDAGIYVGQMDAPGAEPLVIANNDMHGNNIGILVEFGQGGRDIHVLNNRASKNKLEGAAAKTGILLREEDDVLVQGNRTIDNGTFGIHVDADSDDNVINNNVASSNPTNFLDQGQNNCGSGNSFAIAPCA